MALTIGVIGACLLSELLWPNRVLRTVTRVLFVVPRAVHEVIWALLLIQVLGFDPLVGIVAIGIPFGAVTAKVFAESIDEADPAPYRHLIAGGATRIGALLYGIAPSIRGPLVSYSFYRLECAIRSAAVLGVIGAGGLGFQLDLSFESLRYGEIWTLIAALVVLSGVADWWSSTVRRSTDPAVDRRSVIGVAVLVPLSCWWVDLDLSVLWSGRWTSFAGDLVADLAHPEFGPRGWPVLRDATIDTAAMSVLALTIAVGGGLALGALSARPAGRTAPTGPMRRAVRIVVSFVLLLARAIPAPVWAFLFVLVLFPGPWPGAVALGVYNLGVLGRLFAEIFEEGDPVPADALVATGAGPVTTFFYARLPTASGRLVSIALYRWEVIVRETVVVGVVGAGGLGQLVNEHLAGRNFSAVASAVLALIVLSLVIDALSGVIRRTLRTSSSPLRLGR